MPKHMTSIGGQAIIEGVMMRGPEKYAVAVRKSDGEVIIEKWPVKAKKGKSILKWWIIRGVVNFFSSIVIGMKALMFSAEFFDTDEEPDKIDKWLDKKFGDKSKTIAIYFAVIIALALSVGLFIILPTFIAGLLFVNEGATRLCFNLTEGVIRIILFMGYIMAISTMKDIQRVFEYHGAEHKTIHCYEAGEDLTVENVKKFSRLHPRCGTSFLLIVMVLTILVFSIFSATNVWIAILQRLILLPLVAGIAYEIIKFAGRSRNRVVCLLNKPGMWFQKFTTREPDEKQIFVAIESLKNVIPENKNEDKW